MKRPWMRALQGLALSIGSPIGWLALQWLDGADPFLQLVWHPGVYVYMLFGTAIAFGVFGWYVGRQYQWADAAMYRAKQEGRDRVAAAESSPMATGGAAPPEPRPA